MANEEIFLRLSVPLFLGMLIGFERIYHGHDAGMRTHGITAMGSALFILTGITIGSNFETAQETWRALAQVLGSVIMGVGFLGGGLIFTTNDKDHHKSGLTSAATLWATAAIGSACGFGYYMMAIIVTGLIILTLTIFAKFEWWALKKMRARIRRRNRKESLQLH